jgi:hypothetical protein
MRNDDADRPDEMTDAELEQFLAVANRDLLDHIEATTDASHVLTKIMARSVEEATPAEIVAAAISLNRDKAPAAVVLSMRIGARDLADAFDRNRVRDLKGTLADAYGLALALALADADGLALDRDRVRDRVCNHLANDLADARNRVRDLVKAVAVDGDLADVLALDRRLVSVLEGILSDAQAHAQALAYELARVDTGDPIRIGDLEDALDLALDHARDLADALVRTLALAGYLDARPVDASGADLSGMAIRDVEALDGVVWSERTTWPDNIADQVREHSEEIGRDVYRVRLGHRQDDEVSVWM